MTSYIAWAMLAVSLFFNVSMMAVLTDNEAEIEQFSYALDYVGAEYLKSEDKIAKGLCLEKLW